MIILGIDPGYGRVGYGVIKKQGSSLAYITAGCVETQKTDSPAKRLRVIHDTLSALIETQKPEVIVVEQLFFAKNTKTALRVAETRGVLLLLSEIHQLRLREFTPLAVKMAVCGYGRAEKQQVQRMVMKILALADIPKPDDAADALAIAITATTSIDRC